MNGNGIHQDNVYVLGYKFSGVELVHMTVDKLLASKFNQVPPNCRNKSVPITCTPLIHQPLFPECMKELSNTGTKVVLVVRNPKDVAVAMHMNSGLETVIPFSDVLDRFMADDTDGVGWFDHTRQWLEVLSSMDPAQLHIIYFDSLIQDLEGEVHKLCMFLDVHLSPERGVALCTQMIQESDQPQRKRQRTNSPTEGHTETYYQVGLWKTYFTVGHNELFNSRSSSVLGCLKLLDLNRLLS